MGGMRRTMRVGLLLALLPAAFLPAGGQVEGAKAGKPAAPVKIQFWHDWAPDGAQGLVLQKLLDEFNAANASRISVGTVYMGGKRAEKIAAALAAKTAPDIAWISSPGTDYYEAGQLLDMARVYDGKILDRNDMLPTLLDQQAYLGKDITLPFENSSLAVLYNKKMLAAKGVAFPSAVPGEYTWKQFIADCKVFSDAANRKYGWEPRLNTALLDPMFWEAGGEYFSKDLKKNLLVSDEKARAAMVKVLNRVNQMVSVDKITANDVGDQGFANGDMAFEITGPWAMPRYLKPQGKFDPGDIGVAAFPADDETKACVTRWYQKALALFKTNAAQEGATLQFIKWFYSAPIHARWCAEASYLPVTKSALKDPAWIKFAAANTWVDVFVKQIPLMRRLADVAAGDVGKILDTVRFGKGTPEQAIAEYGKNAQKLLDEFWSLR